MRNENAARKAAFRKWVANLTDSEKSGLTIRSIVDWNHISDGFTAGYEAASAERDDLLTALREVEYQLADLESWEMSPNARKARATEALTAARAAIKKAEGR